MDVQFLTSRKQEVKPDTRQYIIVAVKGQHTQPLTPPQTIQATTAKLKQLKPNWKGYILQIRTPEGYKNVKIYKKGKLK